MAIGCALFALQGFFHRDSSLPEDKDLATISGVLEAAPYVAHHGKGEYTLELFVRAGGKQYQLTQEDLTRAVPAVLSLHAGDTVIARVKPASLGRGFNWLWAIERNDTTILSYQDTHHFLERRNAQLHAMCLWAGAFALALALPFTLKSIFGNWQDLKK